MDQVPEESLDTRNLEISLAGISRELRRANQLKALELELVVRTNIPDSDMRNQFYEEIGDI